jgi:hypothetical protein
MSNQNIITQIGSLPYDNIAEAVKYSLKHDIPFLPELPKRGDLMIDYIRHPGEMSCLNEFAAATKGYSTVKIQCIGPASIVYATEKEFDEMKAVQVAYEHISKIVNALDVRNIILFLDEPTLETTGYDYISDGMTKEEYEAMGFISVQYKQTWEMLVENLKKNIDYSKIKLGIHTCGNAYWKNLGKIDFLDIISFDASKYSQVFDAQDFYVNKKNVAWGITNYNDISTYVEGDLITPPCGLAYAEIQECDWTLRMLEIKAAMLKKDIEPKK